MFLGYFFALFFVVGPLSPKPTSVRQRPEVAPAAPSPSEGLDVLSRVVAIGDVHGDLAALTAALRLGGLIGAAGETPAWRGGRTKCVVVGDMLDRGDEELQVLNLLDVLRGEARLAGGSVTCLLGNHEVMNVCGDFRYTSHASNKGFAALEAEVLQGLGGAWGAFADVPDAPKYPGLRTRAAAFAPGGLLARRLSRFPVVALIHGTLFVHAALTVQALGGGGSNSDPLPLRAINRAAGAWLRGGDVNSSPMIPRALVGPESLVWSRQFGKPVGTQLAANDAADLAAALAAVGARRMVVGHTPQAPGGPGINAAGPRGGGQCWRIDTGMAQTMGGKVEALEITSFRSGKEARVRVLTEGGVLEADQREAWSASDGAFF